MTEASDGRSTDVVADDLDDEREPATVPIAIDSQEPQKAADQAEDQDEFEGPRRRARRERAERRAAELARSRSRRLGATPSGALAATSPRNLSRSLVASFAA